MKKNILLALCCCSLLAFTGCSDDYTDATSKHIYGENENPYLKTNTNAQVTSNVALEVNGKHAYVLNLSDYTDKFEELMGMSADAAVAGLDTKATVFYPINTTRNQWLKTLCPHPYIWLNVHLVLYLNNQPPNQNHQPE